MVWAWHSHPGRVRPRNEDACAVFTLGGPGPVTAVLAVADGLGGHPAGDVASRTAVGLLRAHLEAWAAALSAPPDLPAARDALAGALLAAHQGLLQAQARDPRLAGMGTTLTAALLRDGRFAYAHVGDSRLYRIGRARLERVSQDHVSPRGRGMLTQALGVAGELEVETGTGAVAPGEGLLLCTDGLSRVLGDEEIWEALQRLPLGAAVAALVQLANRRGGPDNITLAAVLWPGAPSAPLRGPGGEAA